MTEMGRMIEEVTRVHVYRLPAKLSDGYCFGGGRPIGFLNVDWFDAVIAEGQEPLIKFIKNKRYFDPFGRFLVLSDHPGLTFTIEPGQPRPMVDRP